MVRQRASFLICVLIAGGLAVEPGPLRGQSDLVISITKLMPAPGWALAERRLLSPQRRRRGALGVEISR